HPPRTTPGGHALPRALPAHLSRLSSDRAGVAPVRPSSGSATTPTGAAAAPPAPAARPSMAQTARAAARPIRPARGACPRPTSAARESQSSLRLHLVPSAGELAPHPLEGGRRGGNSGDDQFPELDEQPRFRERDAGAARDERREAVRRHLVARAP